MPAEGTKIADLTAITGADLADGDEFAVVDVSDATMDATGTTKKITKSELASVMGGSPFCSAVTNGLAMDFAPTGFDADRTVVLLVDPTAKDWQANASYRTGIKAGGANYPPTVKRTSGALVRFSLLTLGYGVSGGTEPTWAMSGITSDAGIDWGIVTDGGDWQADHDYSGTTQYVRANGYVWANDSWGTSADTPPDWASITDPGATVVDGSVTWKLIGPFGTWAADTTYALAISADRHFVTSRFVLPTTPNGNLYVASPGAGAYGGLPGGFSAVAGTTGATEPSWGAVASGDGTIWADGEILWAEYSSDDELHLTGIAAPTNGVGALQLVNLGQDPTGTNGAAIVIHDIVDTDDDCASLPENSFDYDGINLTLVGVTPVATTPATGPRGVLLAYSGGRWRPVQVLGELSAP